MNKKTFAWKKGRGKLGALAPLIGTWQAQAETPMGIVRCTRSFAPALGGTFILLTARWDFKTGTYEEQAFFGMDENKQLAFWSFTSDGKHSRGVIADTSDTHPQSIGFEAQMPAGLERMVYWPNEIGGFSWAVEARTKKGWKRFTEHHYLPA